MPVLDALNSAAILAATVLGVNLSIVRPMKDRMEELKREVTAMQSQVQLLVGERDQVRSTNDLLSGLKAQEAAFEEARHSLTTLRQFREQIAAESQKTTEVLSSVEKLDTLQRTVSPLPRFDRARHESARRHRGIREAADRTECNRRRSRRRREPADRSCAT